MTLRSHRACVALAAAAAVVWCSSLVNRACSTTTTPTTPGTTTGTIPPPFAPAGVVVNADGVLRKEVYDDPTGALMRRRIEEANATLNDKVAARSNLRKVSLTRLEKACVPGSMLGCRLRTK